MICCLFSWLGFAGSERNKGQPSICVPCNLESQPKICDLSQKSVWNWKTWARPKPKSNPKFVSNRSVLLVTCPRNRINHQVVWDELRGNNCSWCDSSQENVKYQGVRFLELQWDWAPVKFRPRAGSPQHLTQVSSKGDTYTSNKAKQIKSHQKWGAREVEWRHHGRKSYALVSVLKWIESLIIT